MANAMANAAGVPLGDVLVYDAQAVNMSGNACITVTMRFTGVDGKDALHGFDIIKGGIVQLATPLVFSTSFLFPASAADRNAQSVQQVVMEGSPSEYSPGLCE